MALRDQPYLPLYIQDFLTDEKLLECSANAHGVYIRLMCFMHKSEQYGTILLKQKDKQSDNQIENFCLKIAKKMPWPERVVMDALTELIDEKVLQIDGDLLFQKRMVRDCKLSEIRAAAGKKGGDKNFAKAKSKASAKPKKQANTEYEIGNENEDINKGNGRKLKMEDVVWPFKSERFMQAWNLWVAYKLEKKKSYKPIGLQSVFAKLSRLSNGDEDLAIKIINQARESTWEGFFPYKPEQNYGHVRNGNGSRNTVSGAKSALARVCTKPGDAGPGDEPGAMAYEVEASGGYGLHENIPLR